ncbi:MAG TPA: flagellar motor protein MotB [Acetobacteraceae bacterium]|nr:flagellar motor protein MotB [Acetobacteraceae bacterium]
MSKTDRKGTGSRPNVIIRKEEVVEAEAHGGAWKVAYADFVTAMMAFFLLMWLLNATTEDQRKGLADYFSPNNLLSHASSGTGQPFGGHTAFDHGAMVSDRGAVQVIVGRRPVPIDPPEDDAQPEPPTRAGSDDDRDQGAGRRTATVSPGPANVTGRPPPANAAGTPMATNAAPFPAQANPALPAEPGQAQSARSAAASAAQVRNPTVAELGAARERQEKVEFAQAAQQIRDAVRDDPALAGLARQLAIDITPQGLRIQILDEDHRSMFPFGSAVPNNRAMLLLQKVTPVLARLSQQISIAGYTDSAPFPGPDRTNWELSTERANATRRLLVEGGLPDSRIRRVTGHADRDPLLPADPLAAANRRIAIVVLRTPEPAEAAGAAASGAANGVGDAGAADAGAGDAGVGDAEAAPYTAAAPAR